MKKISIILIACMMSFQFVKAQEISIYNYKKVAPNDMKEYLNRANTYWSVFAENEVKKGNLTFWAVLVRAGGNVDIQNSPNVLVITSFKDIDEKVNWKGIKDLFPDVKIEDIQTWSLSTNIARVLVRDLNNHVQGSTVDPDKDFNYVKLNFYNSKNTGKHIKFEAEKWKPLIKKAMDEGKTTMKGWGHSRVISPESGEFPYGSVSYDLFSSKGDALGNIFTESVEIPDGFFNEQIENNPNPRNTQLYRIVKVVSAN